MIALVSDDLLGSGNWKWLSIWGQILATFPADEWCWNSLFQGQVQVKKILCHADHSYDTPLGELADVQIFGLLAELEPGGGGTLVIEGSHRVISGFVQSPPPQNSRR